MKIWFDTEFIEQKDGALLLSLGAVDEAGAEFYAENLSVDRSLANRWVKENVLPHFTGPAAFAPELAKSFARWVGARPEFWGYYCAWDWFLLCNLMGGFLNLPGDWPGWCNDINTIRILQGRKTWAPPMQQGVRHHALNDARWTRDAHLYLLEVDRTSPTSTS